jgi:hypothetical protein
MKKIISETEVIAYDYLKAFGFKDEQITLLIIQGKKDLHKELTKLEALLHADVVSLDNINDVLHALKGLLFQLGNHKLAEKLNEIRSHLDSEVTLKQISQLLFDETR